MAAAGVEGVFLLLPPPRGRREVGGVGVVAASAANREFCGGVGVASAAEDRPRRPRRVAAPPGEENVLPIGLEIESSGEEGPVNPIHKKMFSEPIH